MVSNNSARTLASCGLLAVSVYVTTLVCLAFPRTFHQVVPIWVPGGLVVAWLMLNPPRRALALVLASLIGALAANPHSKNYGFGAVQAMSAVHILEAAVCYFGVRRVLPQGFDASDPTTMLRFTAIALGSVLLGMSLSLPFLGVPATAARWLQLANWSLADLLGFVVVAPCIVIFSQARRLLQERPFQGPGIGALAEAVIAAALVFSQSGFPLLFLVPPALLAASFELELLGAAIGIGLVGVIGALATGLGHGPGQLIAGGLTEKALVLQSFVFVLTLSSLSMAAMSVQRRRLGESLRASRDEARDQARRAAMAEEVAGVAHWRFDLATGQVVWSDQMYTIFGLDRSEPVDFKQSRSMIHPEDLADREENLRRASSGGEPEGLRITRIVRRDGQVRHVSGRTVAERGPNGSVVAVFGTMLDVTEQRLAEMAIADSETRFRLIAEHTSDVILRTNRTGECIYISPGIERITGFDPQEVMRQSPTASVHPDDAPDFMKVWRALQRGEAPSGSLRHRRLCKDGSYVWLEGNPTALLDEHGEMVEVVDIIRDVSAQKALEEEWQAARDAAEAAAVVKAQFLANMSHELRTPLTAVLGFSSLLAQQPDLNSTARSYVDRLETAGKALLSIINDVLDFSKLEAGRIELSPRPVSPAALLSDTLELFSIDAGAKGVALAASGLDGLPARVLADPDRLRQILLNLIGNAVKFTEAGEVRASARYLDDGRLEVVVSDTGPGLSAAQRRRLFQRFSQIDGSSTRRHGGSGLGLAICKGLIDAMGGEIGVRSRVGVGSSFRFVVPAPQTQQQLPAVHGAHAPPPKAGTRVLVVDDHPINRQLARTILQPFGVEVEEAENGGAGVACALARPFDLILMDIRMPGFDGVSAMRSIRRRKGPNRRTPILAFSAEAGEGEVAGLEAGFDGRVAKPLAPAELLAAVRRFAGGTALIARKRSRRAA